MVVLPIISTLTAGSRISDPPYLEVSYVVPLAHDVGAVSVDMPVLVGSGNFTPTATVFNYSDVSETFDVTMTMGSYSSTKTVTDLASLTSMQVTFAGLDGKCW